MKIQVLGQFQSHTIIVMATKDSTPSGQVRSTTTPTGEESVTPGSQPSGLGELSASMFTEPDRKLKVIQRAQVSSLMGADKNREPQDRTPKKQSPTSATRPKKPWRCGWKSKLVQACIPPPMKTLTVSILPSTLSTVPTLGALACTWAWLATCWPFMERRPTLEQAFFSVKPSQPVKQSQTFLPGWDALLGGECGA